MKDFENFRLEAFNNILPLVKEVVDVEFKYQTSLIPEKKKLTEDLEELKKDRELLKKLVSCKKKLSKATYNELKSISEEAAKQIKEKEVLIEKIDKEIKECVRLSGSYRWYFKGVSVSLFKDPEEVLLKNAGDVKMEYLREYFYLMFVLEPIRLDVPIPCIVSAEFSRENLLSEEATEYICKYLLENEEEDVANKKIAILNGEVSLSTEEELIEIFK